MTRDQMEELAALDALTALDGEDLAAWERARGENPSALRLRDEFSDAAVQLCLLAPATTAPLALRQRIMDRAFGGQSAGASVTEAGRPFGYAAWAAAAVVVLLVLVGASATTRQKESVVVRDARPDPQNLQIALEGYGDYAGARLTCFGTAVSAGGMCKRAVSPSSRRHILTMFGRWMRMARCTTAASWPCAREDSPEVSFNPGIVSTRCRDLRSPSSRQEAVHRRRLHPPC